MNSLSYFFCNLIMSFMQIYVPKTEENICSYFFYSVT